MLYTVFYEISDVAVYHSLLPLASIFVLYLRTLPNPHSGFVSPGVQ